MANEGPAVWRGESCRVPAALCRWAVSRFGTMPGRICHAVFQRRLIASADLLFNHRALPVPLIPRNGGGLWTLSRTWSIVTDESRFARGQATAVLLAT